MSRASSTNIEIDIREKIKALEGKLILTRNKVYPNLLGLDHYARLATGNRNITIAAMTEEQLRESIGLIEGLMNLDFEQRALQEQLAVNRQNRAADTAQIERILAQFNSATNAQPIFDRFVGAVNNQSNQLKFFDKHCLIRVMLFNLLEYDLTTYVHMRFINHDFSKVTTSAAATGPALFSAAPEPSDVHYWKPEQILLALMVIHKDYESSLRLHERHIGTKKEKLDHLSNLIKSVKEIIKKHHGEYYSKEDNDGKANAYCIVARQADVDLMQSTLALIDSTTAFFSGVRRGHVKNSLTSLGQKIREGKKWDYQLLSQGSASAPLMEQTEGFGRPEI